MPRGKTFTGCWTCRTRRVKCDEARPDCSRCLAKGVFCAGYESRLHWLKPITSRNISESTISSGKDLQRRRLLPANAIQDLTDGQVDRFLSAIDRSDRHNQQHIYGPFSVFTTFLEPAGASTDQERLDGEQTQKNPENGKIALPAQSGTEHFNVSTIEDSSTSDSSTVGINETDDIPQSFDPGSHLWNANTPRTNRSTLSLSQNPCNSSNSPDVQRSVTQVDTFYNNCTRFLDGQTKYLLRHYRNKVVAFFSVLDNSRTPWRMLHLPKAMQAACEIEIDETPEGAPHILLHAILTISAYSLQNLEYTRSGKRSSQHWKSVAIHHQGEALRLLSAQLNPHASDMTESEYQELLAAMLSMVSIDVICGDTRTCRLHLRACEALIRTRISIPGYDLPPLSKALHTTFLYLRVMQVAAGINDLDMKTLDSPSHVTTPSKTEMIDLLTDDAFLPRVDISGSQSLCFDPFSSEMIYGFPVELLFLLSRTSEIIVGTVSCAEGDVDLNTRLRTERDQLENSILDWPVEDVIQKIDVALLSPGNCEVMIHYTHAFHQALIIFFYDKVHRVRPRLLEQYAKSVIFRLEQVELAKARYGMLAGPLLWPAFVAGRQTSNIIDQKRLISWLEESDKIGVGTSQATIKYLHQFWTRSKTSSPQHAINTESCSDLVLT